MSRRSEELRERVSPHFPCQERQGPVAQGPISFRAAAPTAPCPAACGEGECQVWLQGLSFLPHPKLLARADW